MPKISVFVLGRLPKLQKSAHGFEMLHNHMLSCYLSNKTIFTQKKFAVNEFLDFLYFKHSLGC